MSTTQESARAKVAKGATWLAAARFAVNALGLLSSLILARVLVPEDFGLVALAMSFLAITNSLTDLSLSNALISHPAPVSAHYDTAWSLGLCRGLLVAAAFAALGWIVAPLFGDPRLVDVMFALSLTIILSGLTNPRAIMLTKDLIFWQQFMLQVSQKIVGFVVSVAIALTYHSYWALVLGALAGQFAGTILSYSVLPYRPRLRFSGFSELFTFSSWMSLSAMLNTFNWRLDHFLIGGYIGQADLGYYTMGDTIASLPTRETAAPLVSTMFPALSRLAHSPERLAYAYIRAQSLITAVTLPAGVGMALISEPLVHLVLGPKWAPSILVVQALGAVFAFQAMAILAPPVAMATNQTRLLFIRALQGFLIRVPLVLFGLWYAGFAGIIYSRCVSGLIGIGQNMQIVKAVCGLPYRAQIAASIRSVLSTIAMGAAILALANPHIKQGEGALELISCIASMVLIGVSSYAFTHFMLWLAQSRPQGPETEILSALSTLVPYMRRERAASEQDRSKSYQR